ncbi:hypothetical protein ZHAS_00015828 [Anopheles sinensis]|uniref:Uncharacterized protein n=1 Tax=Anopheles sinensis TaxID=74873 RepID=A0A084WC15_ANOSI|nr:hypothetical protein ZHAS_00015828 [Anopheles sinensis]
MEWKPKATRSTGTTKDLLGRDGTAGTDQRTVEPSSHKLIKGFPCTEAFLCRSVLL